MTNEMPKEAGDEPPLNPCPYQTWVDRNGLKRIFCSGAWYEYDENPELTQLRARVKELEASRSLVAMDQLIRITEQNLELTARIRELEGALPHPFTLRRIATTMQQEVLDIEDAGRIKDMADRIEKVIK